MAARMRVFGPFLGPGKRAFVCFNPLHVFKDVFKLNAFDIYHFFDLEITQQKTGSQQL